MIKAPVCTMRDCDHSLQHETTTDAVRAGQRHGADWVGHGGVAICSCHSPDAIVEQYADQLHASVDGLAIMPAELFPCTEGAQL